MTLLTNHWRRLLSQPAAELAVIVIGVTLALWADDWVSERNERAEETSRLEALLDNVQDTLADLRESRENARGGVEELRRLLSDDFRRLPADEQYTALRYGMLFGARFAPELSVYDDLESSGELGVLSDKELRRSLATLNARLEFTRLIQSDLGIVQQLNIDSYLINNLDLAPLYADTLGIVVPAETTPNDFDFINSRKFRNLVMLKMDIVLQLMGSLAEVEETMVEIEGNLAEQLK